MVWTIFGRSRRKVATSSQRARKSCSNCISRPMGRNQLQFHALKGMRLRGQQSVGPAISTGRIAGDPGSTPPASPLPAPPQFQLGDDVTDYIHDDPTLRRRPSSVSAARQPAALGTASSIDVCSHSPYLPIDEMPAGPVLPTALSRPVLDTGRTARRHNADPSTSDITTSSDGEQHTGLRQLLGEPVR